MKTGILIFLAAGLLMLVACRRSETKMLDAANSAELADHTTPRASDSATDTTSTYSYVDPPQVNAGMSIEDAYSAIPHRRTVWSADETTVPVGERAYLNAMFQVLDQAVVARVAGIQKYSGGDFESFDAEGQLGQLSDYVRQVRVPPALGDYNNQILTALAAERQFFHDWKEGQDHFDYTRQVETHQGVSQSSAALRSAYQDLIAKYPQESQSNRDAFFDYHCAVDFR